MIGLATLCWGSLGPVVAFIGERTGLTPLGLATIRATTAALLLLAWLSWRRPTALRVAWRDLPYLVLFGLLTVTGFYLALLTSYAVNGVALATLLLYLGPAIVAVVAVPVYGERLTSWRLLALLLAVVGAALAVRVDTVIDQAVAPLGLLIGLAAAVGNALYSLLGKRAMVRLPAPTVLLYNLGIGAIGLLVLAAGGGTGPLPAWPELLPMALLLGSLLTLAPISLYLLALRELPAAVASILATLEPVVAIGLAWYFLGERLTPAQWLGAGLILAGVMALALGERQAADVAGPARPELRR
jgi:drug/metabolite transporter (DMT)-like permease